MGKNKNKKKLPPAKQKKKYQRQRENRWKRKQVNILLGCTVYGIIGILVAIKALLYQSSEKKKRELLTLANKVTSDLSSVNSQGIHGILN